MSATDRDRGPPLRVAIIGASFSGLGLAIQLRKAGIEGFAILEKADRLGGTWRDNTYPGAACDSPSFHYCYSFEQKTDWSRKWSPQPEILAYLERCADRYGLRPHIRFGTEVTEAQFDAEQGLWRIRTGSGEEVAAQVLVSGVGQLNRPFVPPIPGLDRFRGPRFHSARWDHEVDLDGKSVGVVGNAASAIQFVPQIAARARRLTIFQRSANWMIPKFDRAYSEAEQRRFTRHPWLARLYRWRIWLGFEMRWPVFRRNALMSRRIEGLAERHMRSTVADRTLQDHLVPDYPIGGKRILISDDYYQTLARDDVEVVTSPIRHVGEDAVVTEDGRTHAVEVLILATGFQTTSFLAPMKIQGLDHRSLQDEWKDGAHAYLGLAVAGFPNFFMMYGPNTNLGHNSIIFMLECQARYIVDAVQRLEARDLQWVDVRPDVMEAYNRRLQAELARTVWSATGKSWYKDDAGRITNNWSGSTIRYWWQTRRFDLERYHRHPRQQGRSSRNQPAGERASPARSPAG